MALFSFRLETPLRVARARRSQLRRELALAMRELLAAEAGLVAARERVTSAQQALCDGARHGVRGDEVAQITALAECARGAIPLAVLAVREAAAREQDVRDALTTASREVQVFERMREEALARFTRDQARAEQAAADDLVLVRRTRASFAAAQRSRTP